MLHTYSLFYRAICTNQNKMKTTKLSSEYWIGDGDYEITAIVDYNTDGEISDITLKNHFEKKSFTFENSKPDTVIAVGRLIMKAGEMALAHNSKFKGDRT